MADTKISALTAATTPLAGTEVLPIVQSGVTVKVANNDLRPKQIQSNATSGVLQIAGPAAAATRVMTTPDANFTAARIDAAQSFTGDQTLSTGNLIIGTAGKGIDFSATPGTGTSELLADYEEGTWLAVISDGTTDATMAATFCTYTKIGRQVTLTGYIATSDITGITGALRVKGLPFTAQASGQFYAGSTAGLGGGLDLGAGQSIAMLVEPGGSHINLYLWGAVAGGTTGLFPAGWTADGSIAINLTYFVA